MSAKSATALTEIGRSLVTSYALFLESLRQAEELARLAVAAHRAGR